MTPLREFLDRVEKEYGKTASYDFSYPFLTVTISHKSFSKIEEELREDHFSRQLQMPLQEIRELCSRGYIRLELRSEKEKTRPSSLGSSWFDLIRRQTGAPGNSVDPDMDPSYVHFYGFKGGQARTTALCAMAAALARDGWRVLVVDLDAEAPSLDLILGTSTNEPNRTVLGLRSSDTVHPVSSGRTPKGGEISVLPFRPRASVFDLDAAALAFEFQVYAPAVDEIVERIAQLKKLYDLIIFDHRTGLGPIAPSVVMKLPGPVVVCSRLDRQSDYAIPAVTALWTASRASGVLLSLSPPELNSEQYRRQSLPEASTLLQALANASSRGEDGEAREWAEFDDHWVVWPFDRSVATSGLSSNGTTDAVSAAVHDLRRLLNIASQKQRQQKPSGARDEGDLIVTQALRQLRSPDSPIILIVGRKGTGKTRLVRQLAEERLGEPLLVPSDFDNSSGGIKAGDLTLRGLANDSKGKEELFWYALICGAIESNSTSDESLLEAVADSIKDKNLLRRFRTSAKRLESPRTFLIDALESAFDHEQTFPFVQSLFRVLESIDATPDISEKIRLRLFVRRDLLERGIQNREQFEDGKRLDLLWDVQTILNFVLTRIAATPWYGQVDRGLVTSIQRRIEEFREGQVPTDECEELLLSLFPKSIQYKNILTTTFLRTYFSDEGREPSFYPRVYLVFLNEIAKKHAKVALKPGRKLDGKIIVKAHDVASESFLQEVSQELMHAVPDPKPSVNIVLLGLVGKTTPFNPDVLAKTIASANNKGPSQGDVRRIFDIMKQLGVFEDHPKRLNTWRAGRLFKTGLKMRFATGT